MSESKTSNAYGIGIMTVIVGVAAGVVFYQGFYLPESLEKPSVDEHILDPETAENHIVIKSGSALETQEENFVPKTVGVQLGIDNRVVWTNEDETPHTVTPDDRSFADRYSGPFGTVGVLKVGEVYEFLFTEEAEVPYHCEPHPWMKGKITITPKRF